LNQRDEAFKQREQERLRDLENLRIRIEELQREKALTVDDLIYKKEEEIRILKESHKRSMQNIIDREINELTIRFSNQKIEMEGIIQALKAQIREMENSFRVGIAVEREGFDRIMNNMRMNLKGWEDKLRLVVDIFTENLLPLFNRYFQKRQFYSFLTIYNILIY
jgi:hypothetical protein